MTVLRELTLADVQEIKSAADDFCEDYPVELQDIVRAAFICGAIQSLLTMKKQRVSHAAS